MKGRLTDKQEIFVQGLIKGMSQRESYRAAYNSKARDDIIDIKACKLLAVDKVRLRYGQIHDRLIKEAEDESIVSAKEILEELKHIAFDDISNYLSYKTVLAKVGDNDNGEPIFDYRTVIELKDSAVVDTRSISEVSLGKDGQFRFKMHDKLAALYKLGEHLGLWDSPEGMRIKQEELKLKQNAAKLTNW